MHIYLQGLTMGLAYVAPIGAQNLFVIQSAMGPSRRRAFLTALIVTFFDVTLALACFFGIGALMERFSLLASLILLAGSLVVIWIGVGLLRGKASPEGGSAAVKPWGRVIADACVVTWFNPQAIIDGTMLLGAFRATLTAGEAPLFILGSASASCLWFFGLTAVLSIFRGKLNDRILLWINRICGCVIIFYGLKLLWSFLGRFMG
ncbi:MAG: LysE family transporter [Clostridiaceae bacterium]|nr:LysE family transporter [Clostridia bacterium]MDY3870219.1 LysE family transporter [Clostridiaceae bacterium]